MNGMRFIPGGLTRLGSERFYPEEAPVRDVQVDGFWIDEVPVTNVAFQAFVEATGYRTTAELAPDAVGYPGLPPELCQAGSLVFVPPEPMSASYWWQFMPGADWRHPQGPSSSIEGIGDHPVIHIAHADALAYAKWAGKILPSEAEWERAARGGHPDLDFAWGDSLEQDGRRWANTWQGEFPWRQAGGDDAARTSPVRAFPANGFGLFDMIGNVWEWTDDWYTDAIRGPRPTCPACVPRNPKGGTEAGSLDPLAAYPVGRKVIKGGSHLCAPNYCQRYRPAARQPQAIDSSTSHVGFRCALRT